MHKQKQNFIGRHVEIVRATNNSYVGVAGIIVDETKETFVIDTQNEHKTFVKAHNTFKVDEQLIEGSTITRSPQERIKTKQKGN